MGSRVLRPGKTYVRPGSYLFARAPMEPRDVFDGLLVCLIAVVTYLEVFGFGISSDRIDALVEAVLGQDLTVYLVLAGILGVAFVGYIAVYLPKKYSQTAPERPR